MIHPLDFRILDSSSRGGDLTFWVGQREEGGEEEGRFLYKVRKGKRRKRKLSQPFPRRTTIVALGSCNVCAGSPCVIY